jgi:hypothetical protein
MHIMDRKIPVEPIKPDRPADMSSFMVTLERPSSAELAKYNRSERYKILLANTTRLREQLLVWITKQGLSAEVSQVSEPTTFNTLFVVSTARAAELMGQAPGVLSVSSSKEFKVDLPRQTEKPPARSRKPKAQKKGGGA